jgi:hypothetical protein
MALLNMWRYDDFLNKKNLERKNLKHKNLKNWKTTKSWTKISRIAKNLKIL